MKEAFIVKAAKAIGDKNRLRILQEVSKRGTMTCSEVQKLSGLSQPTTSHNIKQLAESGLITIEREGKYNILSINREKVADLSKFFIDVVK